MEHFQYSSLNFNFDPDSSKVKPVTFGSLQCSNCSKTAKWEGGGNKHCISGRIEARVRYVVSGGDPPRSNMGEGSDLLPPPNFFYIFDFKKAYSCRLLSAKLKSHKHRMHGGIGG